MASAGRPRIRPEHLGECATRDLLPALDGEIHEECEAHLRVVRDAHGPNVDCTLADRSKANERGHDTAVWWVRTWRAAHQGSWASRVIATSRPGRAAIIWGASAVWAPQPWGRPTRLSSYSPIVWCRTLSQLSLEP